MSLARTAVRIAAVKSITDRTLAGLKVADSAIEPIDVAVQDAEIPIITVTTDDDTSEPDGKDVWSGPRELDLVFDVAVATAVHGQGYTIPQTDSGLELTLDIIEQQIERALFDDTTPWNRVFGRLVTRVRHRMSRRGASAEQGVKFAARQIVLRLDPVAAPLPGEAVDPETPYGALLALMEADVDSYTVGAAGLLRSLLEAPEKPEWKRLAEAIGLTRPEADAIGITPVDLTGPDAEIAEQGNVTGDTINITVEAEEEPDA